MESAHFWIYDRRCRRDSGLKKKNGGGGGLMCTYLSVYELAAHGDGRLDRVGVHGLRCGVQGHRGLAQSLALHILRVEMQNINVTTVTPTCGPVKFPFFLDAEIKRS